MLCKSQSIPEGVVSWVISANLIYSCPDFPSLGCIGVLLQYSRWEIHYFVKVKGSLLSPHPSPKYFHFYALANRLRKSAVGSVMSVRMEQSDFHRTNIREMSYTVCKLKFLDDKIKDILQIKYCCVQCWLARVYSDIFRPNVTSVAKLITHLTCTGSGRKTWGFLSYNKMNSILSFYVNLLLKLSLSQSILITIFTSWI